MPESQPRLAGTAGEIRGTETEPRGSGQEATPLPWSKGRPKRAEAGLPARRTQQRSPDASRKQRRFAPPPPRRPKDRAGAGRKLRMRARRAVSPPHTLSASPAPEVESLPGGALPWGRGRGERGLPAPPEPLFPFEGWGRWFVEAALTGAAAAAASAAAAAAWRRPIHPPAAGRLAAWEGPGAWAARLLRVVARASSSSTNPLPSPPPPPSSSTSSGQPTARPLLEPGSVVVMTPGKHSRAAGAGSWGPGTAELLGKGRRALACGSPPCTALHRAPASRLTSPRKFRARSVHLDPRGSQRLGLETDCQRVRSGSVSRRHRITWLVRSLSKPRYGAGLRARAF